MITPVAGLQLQVAGCDLASVHFIFMLIISALTKHTSAGH
jgi:hypothetical protein